LLRKTHGQFNPEKRVKEKKIPVIVDASAGQVTVLEHYLQQDIAVEEQMWERLPAARSSVSLASHFYREFIQW